jgi:uncharacterized protein (DUF2235 family)
MNSATDGGRNIILLSDGTGNSSGKLFKTNVWRIYDALDLSNASQIAAYDDGVGTSSIKPLAILGGAFGWGLKRNVLRLYTFLCRNYRPGDRIYGFGFSRGAFTIRVLISFILSQGLVVGANSNDDLRRKALRLYRCFRRENTRHYGLHTIARPLRDALIVMTDWLLGRPSLRIIETIPVPKIHFLGLWDTVDAYGLPIEELENGIDRWIWPLSLNDKELNERIDKACHALAIDDKRTTFHPLLWDESKLPQHCHTDEEKLTQVWFAGAHANVGGGYPDDGLSYVPLFWMIKEARKRRIRFNPLVVKELQPKAAPYGRLYDARAGLGAYYRYAPRRLDPPYDRQGACIPEPKIHESVIWRMASGTDGYAPLSLPSKLRIVTDYKPNGAPAAPLSAAAAPPSNVLTFEEYQDAVKQDGHVFSALGGRGTTPAEQQRVADEFKDLEKPDPRTLDLLWDTVWWRRVAYFSTLVATAVALLYPWVKPALELTPGKLDETIFPVTDPLAYLVGSFLPSVASHWIEAYQNTPLIGATLILTAMLMFAWGSALDRRIHDRALAAWNVDFRKRRFEWFRTNIRRRYRLYFVYLIGIFLTVGGLWWWAFVENGWGTVILALLSLPVGFLLLIALGVSWFVTWRVSKKGEREQAETRGPGLWIAKILGRTPALVWFYRTIRFRAVPSLFAVFVVLFAIYGANRLLFTFMSSGGWICHSTSSTRSPESGPVNFDTSKPCQSTGIQLNADEQYQIEIPEPTGWRDDDEIEVANGADGYSAGWGDWKRWALLPMRRVLTEPWFKVVARVGATGSERYVLDRFTLIKPKTTGELYLFVNDAVIGLPHVYDYFYRRNKGTAQIIVKKLEAPR